MSVAATTRTATDPHADVHARLREYERLRPPLGRALRVDAQRFAAQRGERLEFGSRWGEWLNVLKMCWASEDYLGMALYRLRSFLRAHHVPLIPSIINRICVALFRIEVGDGVVIREGVYVPHGNIILAGITVVGRNSVLCPWVGLGCQQGSFMGPYLRDNVFVGTHATVIGDIDIGDGATIGAGSVVTADVAAGGSVAGIPARPIGDRAGAV